MKLFIKTLILLIPILLLLNIEAYSQKKALIKGDTVICFTVKQSKFLLKTYYKAEELKKIDSLNRGIIEAQDTIINQLKLNIDSYKQINGNNLELINLLKAENKHLKQVIKRKKIVNRVIGITGAIALIVVLII